MANTNAQAIRIANESAEEMGKIYVVDPANGSDQNDGSGLHPWRTIGRALTIAGKDDTIHIDLSDWPTDKDGRRIITESVERTESSS